MQAAERPGPTLLQLVVSHARTQLQLTAQLLPLCSSMPHWLAGVLNLVVTANTASRATELEAWLSKYGGMLSNLDVEAVVDCCAKDAHKATTALATGITSAVAANKVRLWSQTPLMSHSCTMVALPGQLEVFVITAQPAVGWWHLPLRDPYATAISDSESLISGWAMPRATKHDGYARKAAHRAKLSIFAVMT